MTLNIKSNVDANLARQDYINNSSFNRREGENPTLTNYHNISSFTGNLYAPNNHNNASNNNHNNASYDVKFPLDIYTPLLRIVFNSRAIGVNKCEVMISELKQTIIDDFLNNTWYGNEILTHIDAYIFMVDRVKPHSFGNDRVSAMYSDFRAWLVSLYFKNLNLNLVGA